MKHLPCFILGISFLFHMSILAQNLVPNPSFEAHIKCDSSAAGWIEPDCPPWHNANPPTQPYYNACLTIHFPTHGVPNNVGYQWAYTGDAYAGINCFHNSF